MTDLIGRLRLGRFVDNFLSQLPAVAVTHKTEIRLHRFFHSVLCLYISEHSLFGRRPQDLMIREMHPTEKVNAGCDGLNKNLIRMHGELKLASQKIPHRRQNSLEVRFVRRKDGKVVGITEIIFRLESMFHKLVEFVHVNVYQKLGGQIAERKSDTGDTRIKTPDDYRYEIEDILIGNIFCGYIQENRVIDVCEKLSDVAFEHPYRPDVVLRNPADEFSESAESAIRFVIKSRSNS